MHAKFLEAGLSQELVWECMLKDFKKALNLHLFMEDLRKLWQI
jgi:hypothetical protein